MSESSVQLLQLRKRHLKNIVLQDAFLENRTSGELKVQVLGCAVDEGEGDRRVPPQDSSSPCGMGPNTTMQKVDITCEHYRTFLRMLALKRRRVVQYRSAVMVATYAKRKMPRATSNSLNITFPVKRTLMTP